MSNRTTGIVPKRGGGTVDRRVARTTRSLTTALVHLVREQRYQAITIQDLLDRAGVGRSTFYAHYRGKDDLLLRSFQGMLEALGADPGAGDPRLAPVAELFHHVGGHDWFHRALARAGMLDRLYQAGAETMSRTIEHRLAPAPGHVDAVPSGIRARALAGALFGLLRWWLEEGRPHPPEEMDAMFHRVAGDLPRGVEGRR